MVDTYYRVYIVAKEMNRIQIMWSFDKVDVFIVSYKYSMSKNANSYEFEGPSETLRFASIERSFITIFGTVEKI